MEFDKLFRIADSCELDAIYVFPDDKQIDLTAIALSKQEPPRPCRFHYEEGRTFYDRMGTGDPCLDLYSTRVLQVLRDGGFTGWRSFPIEIAGKNGERIDWYEGLVITGRCGPIDHSKEKKVHRPPPVPRGRSYDAWLGLFFDPDSWDGSDMFMPEGTTVNIVTEAVKDALLQAKITSVTFKPLTESERSWPV
jgi:hypothetical protein